MAEGVDGFACFLEVFVFFGLSFSASGPWLVGRISRSDAGLAASLPTSKSLGWSGRESLTGDTNGAKRVEEKEGCREEDGRAETRSCFPSRREQKDDERIDSRRQAGNAELGRPVST